MKQLGVGFVLSSILFAGGTANLSGKWEVVVEGYGAPRTQKFELKQSGAVMEISPRPAGAPASAPATTSAAPEHAAPR